jgi:hypothetical protein
LGLSMGPPLPTRHAYNVQLMFAILGQKPATLRRLTKAGNILSSGTTIYMPVSALLRTRSSVQ